MLFSSGQAIFCEMEDASVVVHMTRPSLACDVDLMYVLDL